MKPQPRVAIVVLLYNGARFIERCFASLRAADFQGLEVRLIAVDNASIDGGADQVARDFPEFQLMRNPGNLGFAGGNNVGIRAALEDGCEYVYLLNQDALVDPAFLKQALEVAQAAPLAGSVQSLLVLDDDRARLNSAGNAIHFLGFGYCREFQRPTSDWDGRSPCEITYASGAAVLYRATALREAGLFDEHLFLYHEDLDLGWRLRLSGYQNLLAPSSRVFHRYEFSRNPSKYYFMERNRLLVMFKNLEARNLAVLFPVLVGAELCLLPFAAASGWGAQKLRADLEFLRPRTLVYLMRERRQVAARRKVTDAQIARLWTPNIEFDGVTTNWVTRVVNPAMRFVWNRIRPWIT